MTTKRSRGMSTETLRRLWTRAPWTAIVVRGAVLPEGRRPRDAATRALARGGAGALRTRGSVAVLVRFVIQPRPPPADVQSPAADSGATNASSCNVTLLRRVSWTSVDALSIRPMSARYSHAVVTPSMPYVFLK